MLLGGVYGAKSRPCREDYHCIGQPPFGTSMSHRTKGYKIASVPTRYMLYVHVDITITTPPPLRAFLPVEYFDDVR